MANDRAARMPNRVYIECMERAAGARSAAEVARVRAWVRRRWAGDPRADDLAEALYVHQLCLSGGGVAHAIASSGVSEATQISDRQDAAP
jgi:hypothetical protein